MDLEFSALHLIIGETSPSLENQNAVFDKSEDQFTLRDSHYLINFSIIDDEYYWFDARYGKSFPYTPTVFNTSKRKEEANPRKTVQIETDKQLFGLYSIKLKTLYLSNTKKISLVESYLKSKLATDVSIKMFFKDVDEFIKHIQTIDKLKFVVKSNLFSVDGGIFNIFPNPKDMYGLGMPDSLGVEANFTKAKKTEQFVKFLKQMVTWRNAYEADSLVCVGRDDKNFETIFNASSFVQKITVSGLKDELGMYDSSDVLYALIRRIEKV